MNFAAQLAWIRVGPGGVDRRGDADRPGQAQGRGLFEAERDLVPVLVRHACPRVDDGTARGALGRLRGCPLRGVVVDKRGRLQRREVDRGRRTWPGTTAARAGGSRARIRSPTCATCRRTGRWARPAVCAGRSAPRSPGTRPESSRNPRPEAGPAGRLRGCRRPRPRGPARRRPRRAPTRRRRHSDSWCPRTARELAASWASLAIVASAG